MTVEIDLQNLPTNWLEHDRKTKLRAKLEAIRAKHRRKHFEALKGDRNGQESPKKDDTQS